MEESSAGVFKQSMGEKVVVSGFQATQLVELDPWNRFLGSLKV
jgi:hypothetical protein